MKEKILINRATINQLFQLHYEELGRYAFSILKSQEEAEDVVQKVFIRLWEKRDKIDIQSNARAYLFRSVYNTCLNDIKSIQKMGIIKEIETVETTVHFQEDSRSMEYYELESKIETAIQKLPPKCKQIFRMSREMEKSYKEIAENLNISTKTVENQMGKALRVLRKELEEYTALIILIVILW